MAPHGERDVSVHLPSSDRLVEILHQRLGHVAGGEAVLVDLAHWGDLGGGAGEEDLLCLAEFIGHDRALMDLDLTAAGKAHDSPPGDAVEEAIRLRRMQLPADGEK